MPQSELQPSFAKGELSKELRKRIDLAAYQIGIEIGKNLCVLPRGGLQSRPGTKFIAETKYSDRDSRLVDFVFSTEQAYILEFGHYYIRFYMDGGQIVNTDNQPYEVQTPYSETDIWDLKFEQSADTCYITHPNYQTRKLTRSDHTLWSLSLLEFAPGTTLKENNDISKTITLSGKVQVAAPSQDIAVSDWASTSGNLYGAIISTDNNHIISGAGMAKIGLSAVSVPASKKGHVLKFIANCSATAGINIMLYCGDTKIYGMQLADPNNKLRTYTMFIPEYNANLITDYSNLQIWLTGIQDTGKVIQNGSDGTSEEVVKGALLYWAELQCPLPSSGGSGINKNDVNLFEGDTVTITSSSALFDAKHVNSVWAVRYYSMAKSYYYGTPQRYSCNSFPIPVNGDWSFTMDVKSGNIDEADQFIEKSVDEGATWFKKKVIAATEDTTSVEFTGSEDDECWLRITREDDPTGTDSASYTLTTQGKEVYSYFRITKVNSSTSAEGVLLSSFSRPGVAFANWSEGSWSDYRGWPSAITFFQNRLCFGGNKNEPNTYGMSVVDDYENYSRQIPQVADDAIRDRLPAHQVNAILWFVPMQALIVFTTDSEWSITTGSNGVLSHDSKISKQQTYWGADDRVEPIIMGDAVVFLLWNKAIVRSIEYSDDYYTTFNGSDLSVMADHLFSGYEIVDWAFQQTPNSILWSVRSDGKLLSFTYHKEHQVWAWTRAETQGEFKSDASIRGKGQDDVYFIVQRNINGVQKRFVEMLAHRDVSSKSNFFGVDCGATRISETPSAQVTGLNWLEGMKVVALADGVKYNCTVSGGKITLPKEANIVHVGLEYEYLFKSLQVDINGTSDRKKIINSLTLSVINSCGGMVATKEDDLFVDLEYPDDKNLFTVDINDIVMTTGYDYDGQVVIKGSGVYPMQIAAIIPQVTVGGK